MADAAEGGPAIPTALLLNGHFGALLVAKINSAAVSGTTSNLFPGAFVPRHGHGNLRCHPGAYGEFAAPAAGLSCAQPVRCILAGLESRTAEGITGALVHWFVVTVSTLGLFGILRLLEVRFGENLTASHISGLAEHAPRLAVVLRRIRAGAGWLTRHAELLFSRPSDTRNADVTPANRTAAAHSHGDECGERFPPVRTLVSGQASNRVHRMADALPRERWTLAAGVLFVVLGGIFPNLIVGQRSAEADAVARGMTEFGRARLVPSAAARVIRSR